MYTYQNGFKSPYKAVLRSWVEGPRWARLPAFFKGIEFTYPEIKATIEVDSGWIMERVYFTLETDNKELLKKGADEIKKSVEEYNN